MWDKIRTRCTFIARSNRCVKPRVLWHSSLRSYTLQGHNYWSQRELRLRAALFPLKHVRFIIDWMGERNCMEASSQNLCQIMLNMCNKATFVRSDECLCSHSLVLCRALGNVSFQCWHCDPGAFFCSLSCLKCIMLFISIKKDLRH